MNTASMTIEPYSLALALLAAVVAGLVGSFALMKRMTLAGDVISHIALPGLGLAFLFKINPLVGGAATLLLGIILIWRLEKRTGIATETMIGVVFASSVALGALITPQEDLIEALFGGFRAPNLPEFLLGVAASACIIFFVVRLKEKLVLSLFSSELAFATGVNVNRLDLYYLLIFGATIVLGLQFLGAILVGSLIIIPAAIGRQLAHTLSSFLFVSSLASILSVGIGFLVSAISHANLGPTIVVAASVLFLLSLLKKRR